MRTLLLALSLVLAFPAYAQDFSKSITYTTNAAALKSVLKELSKQSGVKLEAASDLEDEPLILRLNAVPLQKAMDKMADVFAADWVDHKGFWRLERSEAKEAKIRQALQEKRAASIKQSLDKLKAIQQQHPLDAHGADAYVKALFGAVKEEQAGGQVDSNTYTILDAEKPSSRLAAAILSTLDPAALAAIPINSREVFATAPNSQQRPLESLPDGLLDQFNTDSALVDAAIQQDVPESQRRAIGWLTGKLDGPITRVVVAVAADSYQDDLKFSISYSTASGSSTQDFESLGFTTSDLQDALKEMLVARAAALKTGFALDPIAQEIAPFTTHRPADQTRPISAAAQNFLLHPTQFEPLSLATSQIILKTAELENENAICLPTDQCEFYALNSGKIGKTNIATFQGIAEKMCRMTFDKSDGWLVAKPRDPQDAADTRLPRPQLETFIQNAFNRGYVNLDDGITLCGSIGPLANIQLARRYVSYLMPERYLDVMWDHPDMLRVIGLLSPGQQEQAKSKLTIRMADLSGEQREAVRHFVYDDPNPLQQFVDQDGRSSYKPEERTEFLPSGILDDMQLEVTDAVEPIYYAHVQQGGSEDDRTIPSEQLAEMLAETERPELYDPGNVIVIKKLAPGTHRMLTVKVADTGKHTQESAEERHQPDKLLTAEEFLASLPESERQKLKAEVASEIQRRVEYRERVPAATNSAPGGGVKPPAS